MIPKLGFLLQFTSFAQDEESCIEAIKNNPINFAFVKNPSEQVINLAIECWTNKYNESSSNNENNEIRDEHIRSLKSLLKIDLQHNDNQTDEECLLAVQKDGLALQYVKNKTAEIKLAAILQNSDAKQFL
jgi:hypothetical protein